MPRITIGDCNLHVEQHGAGFPVMFISGLSGLGSFWEKQIAAFSREFTVVTHDHRGTGQSDHVRMAYTVDHMAADVLALMDALGYRRAHIVGHSTGGAIAQILAIDHPKRVASVVIAAGWPKPDAYFRRQFMLRREILAGLGPAAFLQFGSLFAYPSWWVAANNETLRGMEAQSLATFPPPEIMLSRIDAILAFDRQDDLPRWKRPALVVGAADDIVTPPAYSETMARAIPNAELKLFPTGGHGFPQVVARDFNHAVLPFLQANTPAP